MSKHHQDRPRSRNDITTTKMQQIYEMPNYKLMREGKGSELIDIIAAKGIEKKSSKRRTR